MQHLSEQIALLAKRKNQKGKSLVKKEYSCSIFQDYGSLEKQHEAKED